MRFLCLHGMGTNAAILEAQFNTLVAELKDDGHEFVFVDGHIECETSQGISTFFSLYSFNVGFDMPHRDREEDEMRFLTSFSEAAHLPHSAFSTTICPRYDNYRLCKR